MDFKRGHKNKQKVSLDDIHTSNWLEDEKIWSELENDTKEDVPSGKRQGVFKKSDGQAFDKPKEEREKITFNINLSMPKFAWLGRIKKRVLSLKRVQVYGFGLVIGLLVVGFFGYNNFVKNDNPEVAGVVSETIGRNPSEPLPKEDTDFELLYPGDKTKETIGDVVRVSPDENDPVYVYVDDIGGTQIQVSQQLIPDSFKGDIDGKLEKTATDFQATQVFTVDTVRVFHGKSSSGVQSLVFIKGGLLMFIKSTAELAEETWAAYISSLHD